MFTLNKRSTAVMFTASVLAAAGIAATATPATAVYGGKNTTVVDHPHTMELAAPDGLLGHAA